METVKWQTFFFVYIVAKKKEKKLTK